MLDPFRNIDLNEKVMDEELFLSNLKDHPFADSYKGTIRALEEMIDKGKVARVERDLIANQRSR